MTGMANTLLEQIIIASLKDVLKVGKIRSDATHQAMLAKLTALIEEMKELLADPASTTERSADLGHTIGTVTSVILAPLFEDEEMEIDATDGTETIAQAKDDFTAGIDDDFTNWGTDVPSEATQAQLAKVYEMRQDADSATILDSLDNPRESLFWTQGQIIKFCRKHRGKLLDTGYATLFPFKVKTGKGVEYFIAIVGVYARELLVYVYRFDNPSVWYAGVRRRVVVPQLLPSVA